MNRHHQIVNALGLLIGVGLARLGFPEWGWGVVFLAAGGWMRWGLERGK